MKRYILSYANTSHTFYGDNHFIHKDLKLLTISLNDVVLCQASIDGMLLVIHDEEYLKKEEERLIKINNARAQHQLKFINEFNKPWYKKIFNI